MFFRDSDGTIEAPRLCSRIPVYSVGQQCVVLDISFVSYRVTKSEALNLPECLRRLKLAMVHQSHQQYCSRRHLNCVTVSIQSATLPSARSLFFLVRVEFWEAMMSCCKLVNDRIRVHFRQNAIPDSQDTSVYRRIANKHFSQARLEMRYSCLQGKVSKADSLKCHV
jgi:hypothetical protein